MNVNWKLGLQAEKFLNEIGQKDDKGKLPTDLCILKGV